VLRARRGVQRPPEEATAISATGNINDVFSCIVQVGRNACGLPQSLEAVRAALGDPARGVPPPAGNLGFLRDGALLAIVLVKQPRRLFRPGELAAL
jgi:hypothetical protein